MIKEYNSTVALVNGKNTFCQRLLNRINSTRKEDLPQPKKNSLNPNQISSAQIEFKLNVSKISTNIGKIFLELTEKKSLSQICNEKFNSKKQQKRNSQKQTENVVSL